MLGESLIIVVFFIEKFKVKEHNKMDLKTRWIDDERWFLTNFEKEKDYIRCFYSLSEAEQKLKNGETLCCSIKLFKINNK